LLDVVSEPELDAFLRRLVAETAGGAPPPATGRALAASFRRTAERTLPTLTVALGDEGRPAGPEAAQAAARMFGLELEGMSPEDRDFEIARRFVRFAQAETARAAR
jgi:hypothetical protein